MNCRVGRMAEFQPRRGAHRRNAYGIRRHARLCGLTEAEVLERWTRRACRLLDLTDVPRALPNRDTRGAIKVIADADTGRVHQGTRPAGEPQQGTCR